MDVANIDLELREKEINPLSLEITSPGNANGVSLALSKSNGGLSKEEKEKIIERAADKFGEFLDELGCDWRNDPNSYDTPKRVAKAYVNDLWKGRYEVLDEITSFPSDGYSGIVQESNIPIVSMCSHHHQAIIGTASIAYVPTAHGRVIGLSKLNRIVEHFSRRGSIQEQLTMAIHNAVDKICVGNQGVAVMISATHNCVSCRGVRHQGASMQTTKLSGCFMNEDSARAEFYKNIELSKSNK